MVKKDFLKRLLILLLSIFFLIYNSNANAPEVYLGEGIIEGKVTDALENPLPGSVIVLHELNTGTSADANGNFKFRNLRDGAYKLHVTHMGFRAQIRKVELRNGHASVLLVLEATHIELDEVIVRESATGMVQPEQSLSITVATRGFLSESSSMTLMQTLQRLPGINSMDIGTGVSKPVIRGLGFNRLVVAQNNIKQQGQQWGADHGLEIDLYNVERVEVLKGPASLIYGSDAIGGALNIRPPVVPQENTTNFEVTTNFHSNNDLLGTSAMAAINNNGRFFRVRLSYQDYADYRVPADEFVYNIWVMPIPNQRLKNTSGNDLGVSLTGGLRKPWGITTLSVSNFNQQVGFFPASHGIPNPESLQDPGNPRQTEYPMQKVNHFKLTSNTNFLRGSDRIELDVGFQQNHRQELNPPHVHGSGPLPEGFTELELILNTFSANFKYYNRITERKSFVYGFSGIYQDNTRGGYNFLLPDYNYGEAGLFFISRFNVSEQLFLNGGIRADAARVDITGYFEPVWQDTETISGYRERTPDLQRNFFNVAFSSGLSWMPVKDLNLKMNLGSGFRNPGAIELSANGIHHGSFRHEMGDTTLQTERAWQLDFGFTWSKKDVYLHFSPFINYFPNFIFLNPSGVFSELPGAGQIYRFEQSEAIHMGGEFYADWHISHALHTSAGIEWVWAQNLENNFPLPFTPPPSLLGELNYLIKPEISFLKNIKLISSVRHTTAQNRIARNEPATGAYTLTHAGVSASLHLGDFPLDIMFMVNNVFDVLYKNHLSFYRILELPEPGRNFTLRITAGFTRRNGN
jgi:iron complex outermembrane recepter protein